MDLNLYLGLPRPRRRLSSADLGSDLALGSSPLSSSTEDSPTHPVDMPGGSSEPPSPYPHAPYSPSHALIVGPPDPPLAPDHRLQFTGDGSDDTVQEYSPRSPPYRSLRPPFVPITPSPPPVSLLPYDPLSTIGLIDEPLVGGGSGVGGSSHVRYSPSYLPLSAIPEDDDEDGDFTPYRSIRVELDDRIEADDRSSLHPDFLDPEFRLRRLIELQRRSRDGRLPRLSHPYGDEPPEYALEHDTMNSDGSAGNSRKNNMGDKGIGDEGLEEKEEKTKSAVNFECNICLDLAQEPVVTCCGHLFCWPCLYQWLHLHSNHSECPVCKGEVIESNITPIFGRGNSESGSQEGRDGSSCPKIPPRPRGHRIESWRQRLRRPISRRFSVGIANSWRRVLGEEMHHVGNGGDGDVEASLQELINSAHRRVTTRLRARRWVRVEDNSENGSFSLEHTLPRRNGPSNQQTEGDTSSVFGQAINHFTRFSFGGFDGRSANLSRIFGRYADTGGHSGPSASPDNPQNADDLIHRPSTGSGQAMDQASASSTMAVIQGDVGVMDVATEPNSAGSSRPPRRRGRSSSSLDVDGCALHARKRRRLN